MEKEGGWAKMDGGDAREGSYIRKGKSIQKRIGKREKRKIVIREKKEENKQFDFFCKPSLLGSTCVKLNSL